MLLLGPSLAVPQKACSMRERSRPMRWLLADGMGDWGLGSEGMRNLALESGAGYPTITSRDDFAAFVGA
jgi:hypothetical protein